MLAYRHRQNVGTYRSIPWQSSKFFPLVQKALVGTFQQSNGTRPGYIKIAIEDGPVEIVDLPIKNSGFTHWKIAMAIEIVDFPIIRMVDLSIPMDPAVPS